VSAGTWPAVDERLVRRYRRLLLAYSGRYRRLHGTEMITTILEMAEPTRSRPSAGEAWHLIGSGVRQRFRLPSGRPFTLIAAVLVTMVLGVFGAAAGSWLVQSASAGLPSRPDALKLLNSAVTDPMTSFIRRSSATGRADSLSFSVSPRAQRPNWTVENARTGLTAAGWTITEFTVHPSQASITCTTDAASGESCTFESPTATLTAERDGLILRGTATDFLADKSGEAWIGGVDGELFTERGAAYLPLTVAGGLLGALAGWLLTAALAYRARSLPPASRRLAAAFTGVAVTIAAPPVWAIIVNAVMLGEHLTYNGPVYALHTALRPGSPLDGVAAWFIPACTIAAAVAATIAVGILVLAAGREEPPGATQPT
jgi:hypothetical protein